VDQDKTQVSTSSAVEKERAMNEKLAAEAVKQLRNILSLFVTVALVWLVSADAVRANLIQRDRAKHLAAWLLIRDTFASVSTSLADVKDQGPISCIQSTVPIQSGTEISVCTKFQMRMPWTGIDTVDVQLERLISTSSAYRVIVPIDDFPFAYYALTIVGGHPYPIPAFAARSERDLHNAVLRDGLAAPREWGAVRVHLYARGWKGSVPNDLQLNDPAVAAFIRDGQSSSYAVSGIPFSAGAYPAAVSAFLCLLAFLLVGPWLTLRSAPLRPSDDPWVMIFRPQGAVGIVLTILQSVVTAFIVILPCAVIITQLELRSLLSTREAVLMWPVWGACASPCWSSRWWEGCSGNFAGTRAPDKVSSDTFQHELTIVRFRAAATSALV
jgi:hypothetical protein